MSRFKNTAQSTRILPLHLSRSGAIVVSIPIYRWALPADLAPLRQAICKILRGEVDAALFTSGTQVEHLFKVAADDNAAQPVALALKRIVVASIGPVCTQALERFEIRPDIEPPHPKMGILVAELAALAQRVMTGKGPPAG
ncbi:MAG TPA: uroporphyrinogen-III synthase [Terriglobales bacterium]|nr:uroporphyrinogen-III synthase [Terriglobales bacterium]